MKKLTINNQRLNQELETMDMEQIMEILPKFLSGTFLMKLYELILHRERYMIQYKKKPIQTQKKILQLIRAQSQECKTAQNSQKCFQCARYFYDKEQRLLDEFTEKEEILKSTFGCKEE